MVILTRCFQTAVLEKTSERPLDIREIKSVNPKVNQLCLFIGRTEAKAPRLLPPDVKLTRKDLNAEKEWGQEKKEATEDDGWMESSTEWAWVWGIWEIWRTGKPGTLAVHGVTKRHDWVIEQQQYSDRYEVIPHCSFDLHFSNNWWCWASFHVFVGHLYVFFSKMSV